MLRRLVCGLNMIRVGDVTGPDKYYGAYFRSLDAASKWGWRWSKDPVFAFLRVHYFGKDNFGEKEWAEIVKAATKVKRAPFNDQPSRALPNWATILESGRDYDDFRFKNAAAVRTGIGWGHHHNDTLDLQGWSHGTMATCDAGQRPGYSRPSDRSYLEEMSGNTQAGNAPDHFTATFRIHGQQIVRDLGKNAEASPSDYYTKLHVLGQKGARILQGDIDCFRLKYQIPMIFIQKRGKNEDQMATKDEMQSVFAAVIEPYVKTPFISNVRLLDIPDNGNDAARPVALEVKTTNGHTDICFADTHPEKTRLTMPFLFRSNGLAISSRARCSPLHWYVMSRKYLPVWPWI